MSSWIPALQSTTLSLALLWLGLALTRRERPALLIVWAVFCASIALLMTRQLAGDAVGVWTYVIGLGTCATCNAYWLVARGLFRAGRPFTARHLAYAGLIGALIVARQALGVLDEGLGWITPELRAPLVAAASSALGLLSSTALLLAFWEALRGWGETTRIERRLRGVFLVSYGTCVAVCSLVPAVSAGPDAQASNDAVAAAAALLMLLVTQGLVHWRLRHPMSTPSSAVLPNATNVTPAAPQHAVSAATLADVERAEDRALAARLEQAMRTQRWYLRTDLKLVHLAQQLDVCEYQISRAIRASLGMRNVNQYINAYRLAHARALLEDPQRDTWSTLVVGLESGFGSLGAFHRALKAELGCTPGEYRAARQASPDTVALEAR